MKDWIAKSDPPHGSTVRADYQSSGRGQYGRMWLSAAGQNLLLSIHIDAEVVPEPHHFITMATGLGVIQSLQTYGIHNAKLKWPNDVYLENHKLAGILVEKVSAPHQKSSFVVGIGLNVKQQQWPADSGHPTYMEAYTEKPVDIEDLSESVRMAVLTSVTTPTADTISAFNQLLYARNHWCSFTLDDNAHEGILSHLDLNGHLHFYTDTRKWYVKAWEVRSLMRITR